MKKFLSILLGLIWIILIPLYIVFMILGCFIFDATILDFLKAWIIIVAGFLSGNGLDTYGGAGR